MANVGSEEAALQARRRRRLMWMAGVAAAAVVALAIAIAAGSGGGKKGTTTASQKPAASGVKGVSAVLSEFNGIPQRSNELGSPNAKATLMVFADLQCPFCAQWDTGALPGIVQRYVKPGLLKVVFQPIVIIGNDSVLGARAAAAAAQQHKLFEFTGLVYRNQGRENSGYLNNAFVRKIAGAVPGLDAANVIANLKAPPINNLLNQAQSLATTARVNATPTFFVAKRGQALQHLTATSLTASGFYPQLDALTR